MAFCPPGSTHEEAGLLLVGAEGGKLLRCQVGVLVVADVGPSNWRQALHFMWPWFILRHAGSSQTHALQMERLALFKKGC